MAGKKELDDAIQVITKYHSRISILHCVSEYPTKPKNVNLNTISYLLNHYKQYVIGYSDHTIGISTPVAAIAMGAKIIEKHITLDRRMKGTDQEGSLGPDGVYRLVRDVRILDDSIGTEEMFIVQDTSSAKEKLERSIASNRKIGVGEEINKCDIHMLSPGDGFKWIEKDLVIGKKVKKTIEANEIIYKQNII
jgi:sialic acid synthase